MRMRKERLMVLLRDTIPLRTRQLDASTATKLVISAETVLMRLKGESVSSVDLEIMTSIGLVHHPFASNAINLAIKHQNAWD